MSKVSGTSQALRVGDSTDIDRLKVHAIADGKALCNRTLIALFQGSNGDVTCKACLRHTEKGDQ